MTSRSFCSSSFAASFAGSAFNIASKSTFLIVDQFMVETQVRTACLLWQRRTFQYQRELDLSGTELSSCSYSTPAPSCSPAPHLDFCLPVKLRTLDEVERLKIGDADGDCAHFPSFRYAAARFKGNVASFLLLRMAVV